MPFNADHETRQRRIDARLRRDVTLALRDSREVFRWLNWQPRTFRHIGELVERHRREAELSDDVARDVAISMAVTQMRNLAERIIAAQGKKDPRLRAELCASIALLFDTGRIDINGYGVSLWTLTQLRTIHNLHRGLAPILLVGLWDLSPDSLRRLRCCGYPKCMRPWFVDKSMRRPAVYCGPAHRTRTAEACAPLRKKILDILGRARGTWVEGDVLRARVAPDDPYDFFAVALQRLVIEGKLKFRAKPPRSLEGAHTASTAALIPPPLPEYRLA